MINKSKKKKFGNSRTINTNQKTLKNMFNEEDFI